MENSLPHFIQIVEVGKLRGVREVYQQKLLGKDLEVTGDFGFTVDIILVCDQRPYRAKTSSNNINLISNVVM